MGRRKIKRPGRRGPRPIVWKTVPVTRTIQDQVTMATQHAIDEPQIGKEWSNIGEPHSTVKYEKVRAKKSLPYKAKGTKTKLVAVKRQLVMNIPPAQTHADTHTIPIKFRRKVLTQFYELPEDELVAEEPVRRISRTQSKSAKDILSKSELLAFDGMLRKIVKRHGVDSEKSRELIKQFISRKPRTQQRLMKKYVEDELHLFSKEEFFDHLNNFLLFFNSTEFGTTRRNNLRRRYGVSYDELKRERPNLFARLEKCANTPDYKIIDRTKKMYEDNLDDFYAAYLLFRRKGVFNCEIWV